MWDCNPGSREIAYQPFDNSQPTNQPLYEPRDGDGMSLRIPDERPSIGVITLKRDAIGK